MLNYTTLIFNSKKCTIKICFIFAANMALILNQIVSLCMAFIVMFSTMSMTVNKHYCSNILIDTSVFKEAKTCGMHSETSYKPTHQNQHEQDKEDDKSCCSSEHEFIKGQDELQFQKIEFTFNQLVFVAVYVHSYLELFDLDNSEKSTFKNYKSPPVVKAIFKLDETYLI